MNVPQNPTELSIRSSKFNEWGISSRQNSVSTLVPNAEVIRSTDDMIEASAKHDGTILDSTSLTEVDANRQFHQKESGPRSRSKSIESLAPEYVDYTTFPPFYYANFFPHYTGSSILMKSSVKHSSQSHNLVEQFLTSQILLRQETMSV